MRQYKFFDSVLGSPAIRLATPAEAGFLSELALRSKAYWKYSPEFIESCRSELAIDAERMQSNKFDYLVAVDDDTVVGFYAIEAV